jgi:hypothetical protein
MLHTVEVLLHVVHGLIDWHAFTRTVDLLDSPLIVMKPVASLSNLIHLLEVFSELVVIALLTS